MALSAMSTLLIGLCCLMATVQAYPLMYPSYYNNNPYQYYYNPAGGYYYYYGPQQQQQQQHQQQYQHQYQHQLFPYQTNEVATGGGTIKPIATTGPATAAAPPNTLPGSQIIDIQRITEFFQSLFPFLKPTNPAAATPVTPATNMIFPPYGHSFYGSGSQSPLMMANYGNGQQADPAAAAQQPTLNFYTFAYPMSLASGSPAEAKVQPEAPQKQAQEQPKTQAKV